jgi:hypothetical protein
MPCCFGLIEDDVEVPELELVATEDVYSYFMFIAPTEEAKEGSSRTLDTLVAYLLIFLNLFFQAVLLYAVFWRVVLKTNEWRSTITEFGPLGQLAIFAPPLSGCNTGESLCRLEGANVTCAPPSVQLMSRWHELDLNGDGVWTREEVLFARDDLKCKYVVDPVEVFDVVVKTVLNREGIIWVHPDLRAGKAISEAYFTYAKGDVIMCGYRNHDMCGNLFERGVFDAALEFNTVPRVGNTIDSARKYCYDLLKPGGFCDLTLPSTYSVWKIESVQECKKSKFFKFMYEHPGTGNTKALLKVDYGARDDTEGTMRPLFRVFLFIILSLWVMAMVYEVKQIVLVSTWIAKFPSTADLEDPKEGAVTKYYNEDGDIETMEIHAIHPSHRRTVIFITLTRFIMLCVLLMVGVCLLLKSQSYTDLIMDAVSLVFIVEIAQILYLQVLRPSVREQVENLKPMKIDPSGIEWLNSRPALIDLLWLGIVFAVVLIVMICHYAFLVSPLFEALECTCIGEGARCREANLFNDGFWHHYWKEETPAVFATVNSLKEGGAALASSPGRQHNKHREYNPASALVQQMTQKKARRRHKGMALGHADK